jgi:cyclopropane-fatty-acyl-phospholipid synthase
MNGAQARLRIAKRLLAHARERLGLDIGFVVWDGSTVPADLPADALAIAIADEGAISALIRKPKLDTLANLWVAARIDIRNGTFFDLVARRPKVRTKETLKTLDKGLALRTAAKFLFVPRGGPWPLEAIPVDRPSVGDAAENKKNIGYHYDEVSTRFYALWLDPEMLYTCAYFTDWNNDIATAQRDHLEISCRKLRLKPGDTLLDLGCGWGAMSCYAAQHYGVHVHAVTISEEHYAYTRDKVARLNLGDRVTVELKDFAALEGQYDKAVALGILEHVGIDNHPSYFQTVHRALKPGGLFLNQAITRPAKRNDKVFRKKTPEYAAMTRYIFPGTELDNIGSTVANFERFGFEVHDVEGWREHYARTCRLWHDGLLANREAAAREVGEGKTRLWLLYLAGCSLGFERNTIGIFQTLASKRARGPSGLPPTRADLYR